MIALRKLRDLDLERAPGAGRAPHLSAASGLVRCGRFLHVVADDELHLGAFAAEGNRPGSLLRLFAGELPQERKERKRRKPDLEALTLLPPLAGFAHGALLALGSGSRPNRRGGALLALDAEGEVTGEPTPCDLSGLLAPLERRFPSLNIEGAVVSGGEFCLLQRGNRKSRQNALVRYELQPLLVALAAAQPMPEMVPLALHAIDLGQVDGIPLCFTDAATLPCGDLVFTAVAEDSSDNYHDGACQAAAIGILSREGVLHQLHFLEPCHKVEGIHASEEGGAIRLLLVTDADDPEIPAGLYAGSIPTSPAGRPARAG